MLVLPSLLGLLELRALSVGDGTQVPSNMPNEQSSANAHKTSFFTTIRTQRLWLRQHKALLVRRHIIAAVVNNVLCARRRFDNCRNTNGAIVAVAG